jgi:hypothetical protein
MERLGPEEDPIRSALTSTSGKYASKDDNWGYVLSSKYFLVFEMRLFHDNYLSSYNHEKDPLTKLEVNQKIN